MCLRISIGCCREYESLERNTGTALFNTNCIFVYILSYGFERQDVFKGSTEFDLDNLGVVLVALTVL